MVPNHGKQWKNLASEKKNYTNLGVCAGSERRLRIGQDLAEMFNISHGLKQDDALRPLLYNIAVDYVSCKTKIQPPTAISL